MTRKIVCYKCREIRDYPEKPGEKCNHKTYQYNTELRDLPSFEKDEQIFEDENKEVKA